MGKSINEQITAMEAQLTELKEWKRKAQNYMRKASDFCEKKDEKLTAEQAVVSPSDFEQKIKAFYGLKNADDEARFLSLMLNPQSRGYWTDHRGRNMNDLSRGQGNAVHPCQGACDAETPKGANY